MLEVFARQDLPAPDRMPVTAELIDSLRDVLADGAKGRYDIDAALFHVAMAVLQLETVMVERQAQLLNLEVRIMEAGLPLRAPE